MYLLKLLLGILRTFFPRLLSRQQLDHYNKELLVGFPIFEHISKCVRSD